MKYVRLINGAVAEVSSERDDRRTIDAPDNVECGWATPDNGATWDGAAQVTVARTAKIAAIQSRTLALKEKGVEWPANSGVMHALTDDRIAVYNGAQIRKGVLSYPRKFIGKGGKIVSAANQTEHNDFDATLMARYIALEDVGIQLIEACHAATTTAELEAIVDDRI